MRIDRVSINRLLSISGVLVLLAMPAAAQQGIQISRATYGVQPSGPSCDATRQLQQQCNGKEGCQVYVDPRYLCPDPAYGRLKSVVVVYGCNGRMDTKSFPDGAQLFLQCSNSGGNAGSTTQQGNSGAWNPSTGNSGMWNSNGNRPATVGQIPSIAGRWTVSSGNSVGDLEFSVSGSRLTGNIYANLIPGGNRIEGTINGARVEFDRFSVANQHWSGTVDPNGSQMSGVVTYPGGRQPWTATRP
jgi:hypothetical protein